MHDNLNPGSPRDSRDGHKNAPKQQRDHEVRPVIEREVPLGQHADHALAPNVHAWVGGELPDDAVRKGDTMKAVEFWRWVNDQMARAGRMPAPEYLEAQGMSALPQHPPSLITPGFRRGFLIRPVAAVGIGARLFPV